MILCNLVRVLEVAEEEEVVRYMILVLIHLHVVEQLEDMVHHFPIAQLNIHQQLGHPIQHILIKL